MSIKDQLLSESKKIVVETDALSKALEGVQLSESVKETLNEVFQSKVQVESARLAESHIEQIATQSEALIEEAAAAKIVDLTSTIDSYFEHLTEQFMDENKVAIESGIKSQLAESLLASLKEAFVSHNVHIPEESINVVEEMESELSEARDEINVLLTKNSELLESVQKQERGNIIAEAIKDLTVVQQEQVLSLSEGISFGKSDQFKTRVESLVEMVAQKVEPTSKLISEAGDGLNFKADEDEGDKGDKKEDKDAKDKKDPKKKPEKKIDESVANLMNWM